jgi:hypothetical protein
MRDAVHGVAAMGIALWDIIATDLAPCRCTYRAAAGWTTTGIQLEAARSNTEELLARRPLAFVAAEF